MKLLIQMCYVFIIWTKIVESLFCAKCSNVTDTHDCKSFVQCSDHETCYVEGNNLSLQNQNYELGCMSKTVCAHMTRRREIWRRSGLSCVSCCHGDMCNLKLCSYNSGPTTTAATVTSTMRTLSHSECHNSAPRCDDPSVLALICPIDPRQCSKGCGLCGTTPSLQQHKVCHDAVPECRCHYMDKELHICSDPDPSSDVFCCYYCKAKNHPHNVTCPDVACEAAKIKYHKTYPDNVQITC